MAAGLTGRDGLELMSIHLPPAQTILIISRELEAEKNPNQQQNPHFGVILEMLGVNGRA
jgi:hypothetical protein